MIAQEGTSKPAPKKKKSSIFIDGTKHTKIYGPALRVELRRVKDPPTGKARYMKKVVDSDFVIGLVEEENLPQEGIRFSMPYHSLNGLIEFGIVDTSVPIEGVEHHKDTATFFFTTKDGYWRLTVLDVGN